MKYYSIEALLCNGKWSSLSPKYKLMQKNFAKGSWEMLKDLKQQVTIQKGSNSTQYRFTSLDSNGDIVEIERFP